MRWSNVHNVYGTDFLMPLALAGIFELFKLRYVDGALDTNTTDLSHEGIADNLGKP